MESHRTIELNGVSISFQRLDLPDYIAFRVTFSSKREPIIVAKTSDIDGKPFWTSVPEGRQREAEAIGKLIESNLKIS
jgi:hypothetical protein